MGKNDKWGVEKGSTKRHSRVTTLKINDYKLKVASEKANDAT